MAGPAFFLSPQLINKRMQILGLTGGIATGKSTAVQIMQGLEPGMVLFDCDEEVKRLLATEEIVDEIARSFGPSVLSGDGGLDRVQIRELVFASPEKRRILEGILHPKVRKECLEKCRESSKNPSTTLFVADVPLLFESGFDFGQELNLVVAVSKATQRKRLKARSHLEDRMISSILMAQLPIMEKVARGDVVFWNEGSLSVLERQLSRFLENRENFR